MSTIPPRKDIPRVGPRAGPPKSKAPMVIGLTAAAALGYYFYSTGGDPQAARKAAERDAASVFNGEKSVEESLAQVGSSIDRSVEEGKQRISAGAHQLDESKQAVLGKIDQVDRKIEEEASKAKSGIKGWFGK